MHKCFWQVADACRGFVLHYQAAQLADAFCILLAQPAQLKIKNKKQ